MSLRKFFQPLKKLGRRFRRKPDRTDAETVGEGDELTDLPPQPDVVGDDGNEGDSDEGEVSSMGSPPQLDDLEAAVEGKRKPDELGQSRVDVDEGEVDLGDSPPHLDGEEEPGNRQSGEAAVEGEVGSADPPQPPNLRVSGDREPSGGT